MAQSDANDQASIGPLRRGTNFAGFVTAPFEDDAPAFTVPLGTSAGRARTPDTTATDRSRDDRFLTRRRSVLKHCAYVPRCARDGSAGVDLAMFLIG